MDEDDSKPIELPIQKAPSGRRRRHNPNPEQSNTPRDPRFDQRCSGSNDMRHFLRNYAFLDDIKQKELAQLEKELKKEKDPSRKEQIKATISRYRNKFKDHEHKLKRPSNKKPKSQEKKIEIVERYKELKQCGKLSRYLERKRKKILKKDEKCFR